MSRIVITGPSGGAPNRLEINEFVKNEKFFSLYIQALREFSFNFQVLRTRLKCRKERMQKTNQGDDQSFFQIGGIHGIPSKPWDGAVGNPSGQGKGYCTHSSVLFPTWHRPYVALYEVCLHVHAHVENAVSYSIETSCSKFYRKMP